MYTYIHTYMLQMVTYIWACTGRVAVDSTCMRVGHIKFETARWV